MKQQGLDSPGINEGFSRRFFPGEGEALGHPAPT